MRQLEYTADWTDPSWRPGLGHYLATFELRLDNLNGAPVPDAWDWEVSLSEGTSSSPIDLIMIEDRPGSNWDDDEAVAKGLAGLPGIYKVRCTITVGTTQTVIERNVAVVGGRIDLLVAHSRIKASSGFEAVPAYVPSIDATINGLGSEVDPKSPVYVQFFGRTPGDEYAVYEQLPQSATRTLTPQPDGTTVTWNVPSFISNIYTDFPTPTDGEKWLLMGNAPGLAGTVSTDISIVFEGTTYGPFRDDTKDDPEKPHQISCHKPASSIVRQYWTLGNHTDGLLGKHTAKQHEIFLLKDTFGSPMPGVIVQERFLLPIQIPGFTINPPTFHWTSSLGAPGYHLIATGWPDDGQMHLVNTPNGSFNGFDNLNFIWAQGNTTLSYSATHEYWAGSRATDGQVGIFLASYEITFTRAQFVSIRGTVTHTGN